MAIRHGFWIGLFIGLTCPGVVCAEIPTEIDYSLHIKPILSDRCFKCHGPDAAQRRADLRLDQEKEVLGRVITAGEVQESELFRRITATNLDERMPPITDTLSLTAAEIELIRHWIDQGAPWSDHWSFRPPRDFPVPEVDNDRWSRNPIDRFVLSRLPGEGLHPSPEASREQLLRRVTFDLTGLPPSLNELDTVLEDPTGHGYEQAVERLLQSPRFGERMASIWLDIARYSDTYGYQVDKDRFVWPWRDWVIEALNQNLPYDQFVTWQLAGDLLPDASDRQILATTFNRLHPQKTEGGSVEEEFRIEYVADRTQTFAAALLGLTFECARCHDHKFDPFTQREYYQLSAFFDNIDEAGLYAYHGTSIPTPTLLVIDQTVKEKAADIEQRITFAEEKLQAVAANRSTAFQEWISLPAEKRAVTRPDNQSQEAESTKEKLDSSDYQLPNLPGCIAYLSFEDGNEQGTHQLAPGKQGQAVRLNGDEGIRMQVGNFRRFEPFSVALWMNTPDEKSRAVIFHRSRGWTDAGSQGYQLLIEEGRLSASLIHFWPGNAIRVRTPAKIPTDQWLHVAVTYDGSSRADGLSIFVNGRRALTEVVRNNLHKNITDGGTDQILIGARKRDRGFSQGLVDEFRVFDRQLSGLEVAQLYDGDSLTSALQDTEADSSGQLREDLYRYYLATSDPNYLEQLATVQQLREQRSKLCDEFPEIMVMRELAQSRPTYVLKRGAYDARADQVQPGTPGALPAFPNDQPRNRLGLARWLTDPAHPLTARVAVNRLWQMCFGQPLTRTPEDFGSQGELPTHPQLLDWLSRYFVDHDWDVKQLLRLIVTSTTYRQTSSASPELFEQDPDNRLLARQWAYRLPAEMIRDSALAVSELIVEQIGGQPTRPYELEVSFKPVDREKGPGLFRRSVYTYWKRTGPAPVMMALDASKRDVCRVRRERTTSPLQALVLLNGPQFVESARVLSERLLRKHPENMGQVIEDMFRTLTSRRPSASEHKTLHVFYERQRARFTNNPDRAGKLLCVGDTPTNAALPKEQLAAMTMVANILMSFDEAVMKR